MTFGSSARWALCCGLPLSLLIASAQLLVGCGGSASDGDAPDAGVPDSGDPDSTIPPPDSGLPDASDADTDADAEAGYTGPKMISKKTGSLYEAETQIAVAPDGTIAVVWNAVDLSSGPRIGYSFSLDDGATFTPPAFLNPPDIMQAGTDPAVVADANGNFYASLMGVHYDPSGTLSDMHVFVAKAPAGSTQFAMPVEVTDPAISFDANDHPKILVTDQGTVVVAFMQNFGGIAARSSDGVSWQRSLITDSAANLFSLCEGGGNLYVTFYGYNGIELRTSQDQGATWSNTSTFVSLPSEQPSFNDPMCFAQGSDVWVSYGVSDGSFVGNQTLDPSTELYVAHSSDFGASFPTRASALDTASGSLALHAVLVGEPGGTLDLTYISGAAELDPAASVRLTRAPSGSFGPSLTVDDPLVFQISRVAANWLGDYMGTVQHDGTLYVSYAKNPSGPSHVWFAKVPIQ
jgi:hypothetical protein